MNLTEIYAKWQKEKGEKHIKYIDEEVQEFLGYAFLFSDETHFVFEVADDSQYPSKLMKAELKKEGNKIIGIVGGDIVFVAEKNGDLPEDCKIILAKTRVEYIQHYLKAIFKILGESFIVSGSESHKHIVKDGFRVNSKLEPVGLELEICATSVRSPDYEYGRAYQKMLGEKTNAVNKRLFDDMRNGILTKEQTNEIIQKVTGWGNFNKIYSATLLFDTDNCLKSINEILDFFKVTREVGVLRNSTINEHMDKYLADYSKFYKFVKIVSDLRNQPQTLKAHMRELYADIGNGIEVPETKILKWKLCGK